MRKPRRMIGLLAAIALVLVAGGADAQSVMDLAKREGKVVWYSSLGLSLAQKVCDAFNKKSLGITCELNRDGSERIFQKVMQEAGANLWIADVVHTSDISHFLDFKTKGMLAKYAPAGSEKFRAEFKDPEGLYYILRGSPYVIGINTQKVPKAEAPKRWKDLTDPRWKGKLVHAHPGYSGVVVTGMTGLLSPVGSPRADARPGGRPAPAAHATRNPCRPPRLAPMLAVEAPAPKRGIPGARADGSGDGSGSR